jgi:hypothetical protein
VKLVNIRYMECMFFKKSSDFFFRLILIAFYRAKYWVSSAYLTSVLQFLKPFYPMKLQKKIPLRRGKISGLIFFVKQFLMRKIQLIKISFFNMRKYSIITK